MTKGGRFPWPGNLNPACTPWRRCGGCRRDSLARTIRAHWATGRLLRAVRARHNAWSADESELLKSMKGHAPHEIVAALLKDCGTVRSERAVAIRAVSQKVSLAREAYSTYDIGDALGVSHDTVRLWIVKGLLKATRAGRYTVGMRSPWVVGAAAAEAFLRAYPWMYDAGGARQDHPLYIVVRSAHRGEQWLSPKQLALRMDVKESWVCDLALRGVLPGKRRGKLWFFRASQIPEFRATIEQRRVKQLALLRSGGGRWVA